MQAKTFRPNIPAWLNNAVIDGLNALSLLPLKHRPASDDSDMLLDVWLAALDGIRPWDEARDAPAIHNAFQTFTRGDEYPRPANLIALLPTAVPPRALNPPRSNTMPPGVREQIDALIKKTRRAPSEVNRHELLTVLTDHRGKSNGASVEQLARALNTSERHVRTLVTELRRDGEHVCGTPAEGYFMAANADELNATCDFLHHRAITSLTLESRMRRVSLPDLIGQLRLPT